MSLSRDQKKFAYGKYVFYDRIKSILAFMDPVSKLDVKIEQVKSGSSYIEFFVFFLLIIVIAIMSIFKASLAEFLNIDPNIIQNQIIPIIISIFIIYFFCYGLYYFNHLNSDVDNDLNNFIIPFLQRVKKYVNNEASIKLETNLGSKLSRRNKIDSGTFADSLVFKWFSAELPFDDNMKVFVDLTYVIDCYGKLNIVRSADGFKSLKMKVEIKFVFPKKPSFQKFDYIGANYILDWSEYNNEYTLTIKTVENCTVEFFRDFDRKLGLLFDTNVCNDIIDEVYAKITGFRGFIYQSAYENNNDDEDENENEELNESDLEDLENMKNSNLEFYGQKVEKPDESSAKSEKTTSTETVQQ